MEPILQRLRGEQLNRSQDRMAWIGGALIGLAVGLAMLLQLPV